MNRSTRQASTVVAALAAPMLLSSRCQAEESRPVLVGYQRVGWSFRYTTDLRDDVFQPAPCHDTEEPELALGSRNVWCFAPQAFGAFMGKAGVQFFDSDGHPGPEAFHPPGEEVVNEEQVYADSSRVLLIGAFDAWMWQRKSGRFVNHWKLRLSDKEDVGLTTSFYAPRAGLILQTVGPQLRTWSAQTGQLLRVATHPLVNFDVDYGEAKEASHVVFSPDARLCFYDTSVPLRSRLPAEEERDAPGGPPGPSHVADCTSGRTLWTADWHYTLGFGGDGRTVLAQRIGEEKVEIRAAQSGKLLSKVSILPDCSFIGTSSDGKALYTHDQTGHVFRQALALR